MTFPSLYQDKLLANGHQCIEPVADSPVLPLGGDLVAILDAEDLPQAVLPFTIPTQSQWSDYPVRKGHPTPREDYILLYMPAACCSYELPSRFKKLSYPHGFSCLTAVGNVKTKN